jgi:hypothetical protein
LAACEVPSAIYIGTAIRMSSIHQKQCYRPPPPPPPPPPPESGCGHESHQPTRHLSQNLRGPYPTADPSTSGTRTDHASTSQQLVVDSYQPKAIHFLVIIIQALQPCTKISSKASRKYRVIIIVAKCVHHHPSTKKKQQQQQQQTISPLN